MEVPERLRWVSWGQFWDRFSKLLSVIEVDIKLTDVKLIHFSESIFTPIKKILRNF